MCSKEAIVTTRWISAATYPSLPVVEIESNLLPSCRNKAIQREKGDLLVPFFPHRQRSSLKHLLPREYQAETSTVILRRDGTALLAKIFIPPWNFSLLYRTKITQRFPHPNSRGFLPSWKMLLGRQDTIWRFARFIYILDRERELFISNLCNFITILESLFCIFFSRSIYTLNHIYSTIISKEAHIGKH